MGARKYAGRRMSSHAPTLSPAAKANIPTHIAIIMDGNGRWAQARGLPTPSYTEVERTGPHHNPVFRIEVSLPDRAPAEGKGRSKRTAEQAAAEAMLTREGIRPDD